MSFVVDGWWLGGGYVSGFATWRSIMLLLWAAALCTRAQNNFFTFARGARAHTHRNIHTRTARTHCACFLPASSPALRFAHTTHLCCPLQTPRHFAAALLHCAFTHLPLPLPSTYLCDEGERKIGRNMHTLFGFMHALHPCQADIAIPFPGIPISACGLCPAWRRRLSGATALP